MPRLDGDREGSVDADSPIGRLQAELELVAASLVERQADQAAAVARHEVHDLGGGELGGDDEVALVLAILGVRHDDHAPLGGLRDRLLCPDEHLSHCASSRLQLEPERVWPRNRRSNDGGSTRPLWISTVP